MPGPVAAPTFQLPYNEPLIDVQTGKITRVWQDALNAVTRRIVQGPAIGTVTDGAAASWDGTSGRLLK